jgi:hypothetical protein
MVTYRGKNIVEREIQFIAKEECPTCKGKGVRLALGETMGTDTCHIVSVPCIGPDEGLGGRCQILIISPKKEIMYQGVHPLGQFAPEEAKKLYRSLMASDIDYEMIEVTTFHRRRHLDQH